MCIVDHVGTPHAGGNGAVDNYGADKVAHIGGLAAGEDDVNPHLTHCLAELFGAVDNGRNDLARYQLLVASDGGGE